MRSNNSTSQQFGGQRLSRYSLIIFIVIFISLCEICVQAERANSVPLSESQRAASKKVSQNIDAVLLIDNSGSMDFEGHDPKGYRFESARIFIDKLEKGDNIAIIDFSTSSELIMPLTEVTEERKSTIKNIVSRVHSDRKLTDINSALELALQELSSSRANPAHMAAVILLTDGEIDVVLGTLKEKQRAARMSEEMLFKKILPKYIQSYVPIYTVALGERANTAMLEKLAEQSKTKEQANEQHYFSIQSGIDLVDNFSFIQSQLKNQERVATRYHFTGEPIHHTVKTTPLTKKMDVEVLLDRKEDMKVAIASPDGKVIKPYSQGDNYNLYKVDNPEAGQWDISIEGKGANKITLATYIDDEIKIDLPFKSRFRLDEPIQIFANIIYKNNIVEGDTIEVEFSGRNYIFKIKELLLTILSPDGQKKGTFLLQREGGSYTYFYEADAVGEYTFDFTLRGNVMNRQPPTPFGKGDISLLAQKNAFVFQTFQSPTLLFKPLRKDYFLSDTLTLELSVIKNANLMQNSSILVEVNSPQGTETLSIPRKGLTLYSLQYAQTDQEGVYTFTVMKTDGYEVAGFQQSTFIRPPSDSPWKLLAPIVVGVLAMAGLLVVSANRRFRLTGWHAKSKREVIKKPLFEFDKETQKTREERLPEEIEESAPETIEEVEEDISKEEVKEPVRFVQPPGEAPVPLHLSSVGAAYPIPDEILIWDKYALVEYIHISEFKQKDGEYSYYFECLNPRNVVLNDTHLTKESIVIKHDDIVKVNNPLTPFPLNPPNLWGQGGCDKGEYKFSFKVDLSKDAEVDAIVSYSEDVKFEVSDKGDLIRWFILPAIPPSPQIGDSIEMVFAQGNLLHIGNNLMISAFEPNDIILYHPSISPRQVAIRKDETENYFIRALKNETILNDAVLAHGREEKLSDGDIIKIGVFTFRIILGEDKSQLEIIEYRG